MEITQKSTWPKKPSGVVDWEAVFEHPERGLISLISDAHSIHTLRESTIFVIRHLYARKDDPAEVERFIGELNVLLPDDAPEEALPKIMETVVAILRQIKNERIHKAEEYVRQNALNDAEAEPEIVQEPPPQATDTRSVAGPAFERRHATIHKPPRIKHPPKKKPVVKYLLLFAAMIVATVTGYVVIDNAAHEKAEEPVVVFMGQMKAAVNGEPIKEHIFGGTLSAGQREGKHYALAEGVPAKDCQGAAWVLLNRGTVVINGVFPRQISPKILKDLCNSKGTFASLMWFPKRGSEIR